MQRSLGARHLADQGPCVRSRPRSVAVLRVCAPGASRPALVRPPPLVARGLLPRAAGRAGIRAAFSPSRPDGVRCSGLEVARRAKVRNAGTDGLAAHLYVHEGRRTSDNSIRFSSREANLFTIEWECLADPCWDEDYSTRLPLQLNTEIAFNGVHIWWKADANGLDEARALIGRHFDLACLKGAQTDSPYHIVFPPKVSK